MGTESSSVFYRGKLTFLLSLGDGKAWLHRDKWVQQLPSGVLQVDDVYSAAFNRFIAKASQWHGTRWNSCSRNRRCLCWILQEAVSPPCGLTNAWRNSRGLPVPERGLQEGWKGPAHRGLRWQDWGHWIEIRGDLGWVWGGSSSPWG